MFSYHVGERRLAKMELAEQEQVDLLATAHAPIGQSVNGGEKKNVNLKSPLIVSSRWVVRDASSDLITRLFTYEIIFDEGDQAMRTYIGTGILENSH